MLGKVGQAGLSRVGLNQGRDGAREGTFGQRFEQSEGTESLQISG